MFVDHTLPMLRPVLAIAIVLRTIDAFGTFDQVFVLTRGGPGEATRLLSVFGYETAFKFQQTGYAAALFLTMGLIILALRSWPPCGCCGGRTRDEGAHRSAAVVATAAAGIVLLPIYWMVAASLKSNHEITQDGDALSACADLRQLRPAVLARSSSATISSTRWW